MSEVEAKKLQKKIWKLEIKFFIFAAAKNNKGC